tara:strand:- start:506 stop:1102 length:597 start_codon:yes stop_codon:yes gene_type:complete
MVNGINLNQSKKIKVKFFTILIFFNLIYSSQVIAEIFHIQCLYEKGKKNITINEDTKKIINSPNLYGDIPQNYRKIDDFIYVYEIADLRAQMIIRFIINLEILEEETIYLKVKKKNIDDLLNLKPKFERGEISYNEIDESKRKSFDQWFEDPKITKNKVVKNWRNDWKDAHPEEYIMYENQSDLTYQATMIHRCNFIN